MRILVIGGTIFVGRHIVDAALAAGHEVTVLHRGQHGADLFPAAMHVLADRNDAAAMTAALADQAWDATIDVCAYRPSQVEDLATALAGRGGQFCFISTVSVYNPEHTGYPEAARLQEFDGPPPTEVTNETYGGLKVLCERAATALFGPQTLIIRPTYVVGPHDRSGRFTYWVQRIARGGEVLAPGDPAANIQVIDVRDQASWIVDMIGRRHAGTFHAVSPSPTFTFHDMLTGIAAEVAPDGTTLTWVAAEFLREHGESDETLPLWAFDEIELIANTADPAAAYAAGLRPRPFGQTVRELLAADEPPAPGLSAEREAELLARWRDTRD